MPEEPKLIPASPDDICQALAFALTFDGRKQFRHAGELTARITRRAPGPAPGAGGLRGAEAAAGWGFVALAAGRRDRRVTRITSATAELPYFGDVMSQNDVLALTFAAAIWLTILGLWMGAG